MQYYARLLVSATVPIFARDNQLIPLGAFKIQPQYYLRWSCSSQSMQCNRYMYIAFQLPIHVYFLQILSISLTAFFSYTGTRTSNTLAPHPTKIAWFLSSHPPLLIITLLRKSPRTLLLFHTLLGVLVFCNYGPKCSNFDVVFRNFSNLLHLYGKGQNLLDYQISWDFATNMFELNFPENDFRKVSKQLEARQNPF